MSDPRLTDEAMVKLHGELAAARKGATWDDMPIGERWVFTSEFEAALPDVPPQVIATVLRDMYERGVFYGCPCGCRGDWHTEPWTFSDAQRYQELSIASPSSSTTN